MPGTTDPIWVPTVDAARLPKVLGITRLPMRIARKPTIAKADMAVAVVVPEGAGLRQAMGTGQQKGY